jgi:hypothetical protein
MRVHRCIIAWRLTLELKIAACPAVCLGLVQSIFSAPLHLHRADIVGNILPTRYHAENPLHSKSALREQYPALAPDPDPEY